MLLRALHQIPDTLPRAGPSDPAPSYESIDSQPFNRAIMSLFRRKMVAAIGSDTDAQGWGIPLSYCCELHELVLQIPPVADSFYSCRYDAIVDLTRSLNAMSDNPGGTQERTRVILLSLFPAWLPPAFKVQITAHQLSSCMPEAA